MLGQQAAGLTCAVFSGSMSSGGGGVRAVLTAQKRQPLVHVSPAIHDFNNNNSNDSNNNNNNHIYNDIIFAFQLMMS